jgi:hypothetical protein
MRYKNSYGGLGKNPNIKKIKIIRIILIKKRNTKIIKTIIK